MDFSKENVFFNALDLSEFMNKSLASYFDLENSTDTF